MLLAVLCCTMGLFALEGTVVSLVGKVEMQTADTDWVVLKEGDSVPTGAVISTGFKAQADIKLGGSLLTVRQLTRITLRELTETSDTVITDLYLDAGSVRSDVKPLNNKANGYKVRTPAVTSSVRGTTFDNSGRGNSACLVSIEEGCVENTLPSGETRTLRGGEDIFVTGGHMVSPYSKGAQGVSLESPVSSPSSKATSPLQIIGGELSVGVEHLPKDGFVDSTAAAMYEESLYSQSYTVEFW